MLRFDSPIYLYLLLMIPVFIGLMVLAEYKRRKAIKKLGDAQLIAQLMPDASTKRRWLKFGALQLALVMLILMVARPQMGTKVSNEKRNGIECIIAMDISNSMLAEDVQPSRLDKSKMLVENLVDKFTNDKIGLVVFAGDAFYRDSCMLCSISFSMPVLVDIGRIYSQYLLRSVHIAMCLPVLVCQRSQS
jgi:Ca-activated chloride channel family protein